MAKEGGRYLDRVAWRWVQVTGCVAPLILILLFFGSDRQLIVSLCLMMVLQFAMTLLLLCRANTNNALQLKSLESLLTLSQDPEVRMAHERIAEALATLVAQSDPVFRGAAMKRLEEMADESKLLGAGTIEFRSTESWRVIYGELLRSPGLHLYRSVSLIQSPDYWQDSPGQQSINLNLELHDSGVVSVERIAIIADHLWPETSLFPVDPVHQWLEQQHRYGTWLQVVRESQLDEETGLISDFGIYGNRAVGWQFSDPGGRTQRFVLSFDFDQLRKAEEHWRRLMVFSTPYRELLDRAH